MAFASGGIERIIARLNTALTPAFLAAAQTLEPKLQEYILRHMNTGAAPPPGVRNETDQLYIRSGLLSNSWRTGAEGNATTTTADDKGVHIRFGTSVVYAHAHEEGYGPIPARPSLTPAAAELQAAIVPILGAELATRLSEAWGKITNG